MIEKFYYLYLLTSNLDDKCYIGVTSKPKTRLWEHKHKKYNYYNSNWIFKTLRNGGEINMKILSDKLNKKQAGYYEILFIKIFKKLNIKLTNLSEGGFNGNFKGLRHSEYSKKKSEESQPHKIIIPKDILYNLYINEKLSKKTIAKIYNCGPTSIDRRLKEHNISIRKTKNYKLSEILNEQEILDLYINKDISMSKISKIYNTTNCAIRIILKRNNVKIYKKSIIKGINKLSKNGEIINFYTLKDLSNELNKNQTSVYRYIKTFGFCYGYNWEFVYR